MHFGHKLQVVEKETGRYIGCSALLDTFWLGQWTDDHITPITHIDLGGCILDWTFCGDFLLILRQSPGSDYPDLVHTDFTGSFTSITALIHLVGSVEAFPTNLVSLTPQLVALFLDDGDFLSLNSNDGTVKEHFSLNKLYSDSCSCPSGIYMISDDGSIFHISTDCNAVLFTSSEANSLLAYHNNTLFAWCLTGPGKAFLLSQPQKVTMTVETVGCGPILDAFEGSSEGVVTACGYEDRGTLRLAEKCKG